MTLTVRLDAATESALDRYCAERGVTKSLVVQESLAVYLVTRDQPAAGAPDSGKPGKSGEGQRAAAPVSAAYKAFADAGLIGCIASGQGADKAAVRARMGAELTARKVRRSGT